jgi:hypothetical protein
VFITLKGKPMTSLKSWRLSAGLLALVAAGAACAAEPVTPKTREQGKAETREAMRSGEMSANGEAGCGPQLVKTPGSGKTRAQVKAERDEAIRKGEMNSSGEVAGSAQSPAPAAKKAP